MRKHFLILMLFALLPLAGWAADVTDISSGYTLNYTLGSAAKSSSATAEVDYSGTANAVVLTSLTSTSVTPATINSGLTFVIKKGNATTGATVTEIKDAGDYFIIVSAANFSGTVTAKVTVKKVGLTIKAKCIDDNYKLTYGQTFDASKYKLVYTGLVNADKKKNGNVYVTPDEPIDGIQKGTLAYNVTGPIGTATNPYQAFSPAGNYK